MTGLISKSSAKQRSSQSLRVIVLFLAVAGVAQAAQTVSAISFSQISFSNPAQPYSYYAQMAVPDGTLYGNGYLNVERFENGQAAGWVVRNLPVVNGGIADGPARFDLGVAGQQYALSAVVDFSPAPLANDSALQNQIALTFLLGQVVLPADNNPEQFEDVVCHKDDKKFWTGQASVVHVFFTQARFNTGEASGWIIKGKNPNQVLMMTASHNFSNEQAKDVSVFVNYQKTTCGGKIVEPDFWAGAIDQLLERNSKLDFLVVSLKPDPDGKKYPAPLQALYKDSKEGDIVTIPQHPASYTPYKQAGYYYDIANKQRCKITKSAAINENAGEVDTKCGAVKGTSGSPLLDGTASDDNTPYAIGLITGNRFKPLTAAGFKMSTICDYDAGNDGKKLLDCKR